MPDCDDAGGRRPTETTRRRVLAGIGGAALLGAVAGCTSDDERAVDEDLADSPDVFGYTFSNLPESTQLNPWAPNYLNDDHELLFENLSVRTPDGTRRTAPLIDDVGIDGRTVTVTYDDGYTWWNGEPVTARDRWVAERIRRHVAELSDDRDRPDISEVTLDDEYTLVYELDRPLDRQLVLRRVVGGALRTAAWLFEPWLDRLDGAATADEREAVVDELQNWKLRLEDVADEGFGCGPYELTEVSPNRLLLERFEDHPRADDLDVPTLWLPVAMDQKADELLGNGWIDGGGGVLDRRRVSPPDHVEQLSRYFAGSGTKLALNWHNDHLARRNVRRALLCALPLDDVVGAGGWGEPAALQTGLAAPAQRRWIDDSVRERLHRYPVEADEARAAEYMRAAGYSLRDDRWRGPDGEDVSLSVLTTLWDGWAAATGLVERSLGSFGIEIDVRQVPGSSFLSIARSGNYAMVPWWSDGGPYRAYDVTSTDASALGYGVDDPAADRSRWAKPVEPAIPETAGELDPDADDRERVNLVEQWDRIRRPSEEADTVDAATTIARWWNYDLPDIDLATQVAGVWGNTRDFSWPADGDDARYRVAGPGNDPTVRLLKTGAIRTATDGNGR